MDVGYMYKSIIINEIDQVISIYCDGCVLKKQLTNIIGKTASHQICISNCPIGEQLQFLGGEMNKIAK